MFYITWLFQFLLLFSSALLRICHLFSSWLDKLGLKAVALHSFKSQSIILPALKVFKFGQVPVLLEINVVTQGLPLIDSIKFLNWPSFGMRNNDNSIYFWHFFL